MIKKIKSLLQNELKVYKSYVQANWRSLLLSLAMGIFLLWILSIFQQIVKEWTNKIILYRPPLSQVLLFEWILIIAFAKRAIIVWKRYRNSYFLKAPTFLWIDAIIISFLIPAYQLIKGFSLISSTYLIIVSASLCIFVVITYVIALISTIKANLFENTNGVSDGRINLFSDEPIMNETEDLNRTICIFA